MRLERGLTSLLRRPGATQLLHDCPDQAAASRRPGSTADSQLGGGHSPHSITHPCSHTSRHTMPLRTAAGELVTRTATNLLLRLRGRSVPGTAPRRRSAAIASYTG